MYRRIPLSIEVNKVLRLLMITLTVLLFCVSAYFFVKMSDTAKTGHLFEENQWMQKNLESENRILKQRLLDAQSLNGLKASKIFEDMSEPESTIYVKPKGPISKNNKG